MGAVVAVAVVEAVALARIIVLLPTRLVRLPMVQPTQSALVDVGDVEDVVVVEYVHILPFFF